MPIELKMPALSPTMEKGTLAKWLVKPGDMVKSGDLLAEIETDKATMEFEAVEAGRISVITVPDGSEDVAVGTVIAVLVEESDPLSSSDRASSDPAPPAERSADIHAPPMSARPAAPPAAARHAPAPLRQFERDANATPLAARIAAAKGLRLAGIVGSGPQGKILKADLGLDPVVRSTRTPAAPPAPVFAPPPHGVPVSTLKLSGMRKTIARRLAESKQNIPHFYLSSRCNLDPLLRLRQDLNASLESRGIKLSVNDMLIKALAMALIDVPEANVQFGGDVLHQFGRVDISMAVAIDGGLLTPVIRGVDQMPLSAIARESRQLAAKAREGKLAPEDYQGGTASLSNLGMFGIDEMFPVINPPQAMILGVAAGIEQPWKVGGALALATVMTATGSFDHRAIDGAVGARLMAAFKHLVEAPMSIVS